jgi:hypothetical protein
MAVRRKAKVHYSQQIAGSRRHRNDTQMFSGAEMTWLCGLCAKTEIKSLISQTITESAELKRQGSVVACSGR